MTQVGFVYKLCCNDPEIKEVYVGSTKNLRVRKNLHKSRCHNENGEKYNLNVYQFIRANGGFSNFDIIQLERFEFNTKYELHARERHYIELLKASLNKAIPTRTVKEYRDENKEKIKEQLVVYREKNKEKIQEYEKKRYEENKEKLKEKNKKYYEENKERNKEKKREINKKYGEENKEKINARRRELRRLKKEQNNNNN